MLQITAYEAIWFLPFLLPVIIYVAWSDMRAMKIPNLAVGTMVVIFAVIGLIALSPVDYGWRWLHLVVVLGIGIVMNAMGLVGAGDAKFAAAAAPFVALGDVITLCYILAGCILAAYVSHRIVKNTALRKLAPDWQSWQTGRRFPMGFPLAGTLGVYLAIGAYFGA